jgi:Domain of unknown function (DUF6891)
MIKPNLSTLDALNGAIEMLREIMNGRRYNALDYLDQLMAFEGAAKRAVATTDADAAALPELIALATLVESLTSSPATRDYVAPSVRVGGCEAVEREGRGEGRVSSGSRPGSRARRSTIRALTPKRVDSIHTHREKTMNHETHKAAITAAFKKLRAAGYIARQNYLCCGSCASAAIGAYVREKGGDPDAAKAVYYHRQANECWDGEGNLNARGSGCRSELWMCWSGDGATIVAALKAEGLEVEWDGSDGQCIGVTGWRNVAAEAIAPQASFATACGVE